MFYGVAIHQHGTPTAPEERQRPGNVSDAAAALTTLLVAWGGSLEYFELVLLRRAGVDGVPVAVGVTAGRSANALIPGAPCRPLVETCAREVDRFWLRFLGDTARQRSRGLVRRRHRYRRAEVVGRAALDRAPHPAAASMTALTEIPH